MAEACPWCGEPDAGGMRCTRCGGSLLVDITVDPIADDRTRFAVARALSALGHPLGSFSELKAALATSQQIIARGASRSLVERVNAALQPFGLAAHGVARGSPTASRTVARALAGALVLAVAVPTWYALRTRGTAEPAPAPPPAAALAVKPPAPAAATPADKKLQLDKKAVYQAIVQLSCGGKLGSGFFIDADLVLTNAHVVCADGDALKVTLADGRGLIGKVERRDDWLDWAMVRVAGATQQPLKLGDSTELGVGDPIAVIGSPIGLSFTWHEGKIGFVGRNYLGVSYLQLDANINSGNSGGPVVNARGEAVGIVTMKVTKADGIGLALPIEYVEPPEGEALDRWNALLEKAHAEDSKETSKTAEKFDRPALVEAKVMNGLLLATILTRSDATSTFVGFQLMSGRNIVCHEDFRVDEWVSVEEVLKRQPLEAGNRELRWVIESRTLKGVMGGIGWVDLRACPLDAVKGEASIVLKNGTEGRDRVSLSPSLLVQLTTPRTRITYDRYGNVQGRGDGARDQWHSAFSAARARVESARANVESARAQHERSYTEQAREAVRRAEKDVERAEQALNELERSASNQGVPLEWRK